MNHIAERAPMKRTPLIYLASPIDHNPGSDTREKARKALLSASCAVLDPAAAWSIPEVPIGSSGLQKANMASLRYCDGLLATLDPRVMSVGVVLEIQEAQATGKPLTLWGPNLRQSWALDYLGILVMRDLGPAIENLKDQIDREMRRI